MRARNRHIRSKLSYGGAAAAAHHHGRTTSTTSFSARDAEERIPLGHAAAQESHELDDYHDQHDDYSRGNGAYSSSSSMTAQTKRNGKERDMATTASPPIFELGDDEVEEDERDAKRRD